MFKPTWRELWIAFLVAVIVTPPLMLLRGVVLLSLWDWFIVPLSLPSIGMAHALGLSIAVSMFVGRSGTKYTDDKPLMEWRNRPRYVKETTMSWEFWLDVAWRIAVNAVIVIVVNVLMVIYVWPLLDKYVGPPLDRWSERWHAWRNKGKD